MLSAAKQVAIQQKAVKVFIRMPVENANYYYTLTLDAINIQKQLKYQEEDFAKYPNKIVVSYATQ